MATLFLSSLTMFGQNRSQTNRNQQSTLRRTNPQDIPQSNRNNEPVLKLTDAEVNKYWKKARSLGYELNEIPELARAQGFSDRQANLLFRRIIQLNNMARGKRGQTLRDLDLFNLNEDSLVQLEMRKEIFGMNVFDRAFMTSFAPNLNMATPENYVLGPNDELSVLVYGTSQRFFQLRVDAEGLIRIPVVGPIQVSGLSINAAKELIKEKLSTMYSGLKGTNPTVSTDIALTNLRSIRVNIIGEVERPGTYEIPAYSSVFNALYGAGGPTTNGTFRAVKVLRGGVEVNEVDLYDFLVFGEDITDDQLEDNDIILVNAYENRIRIKGEVRRQGLFELKDDENLGKIVNFAGGLTASANTNNFLVEKYFGLAQKAEDHALDLGRNFNFRDGDVLTIRKINSVDIDRIQIEGPVQSPGIYSWYEGQTLDSLIIKAGGLMPGAYNNNISIFRFKEDFTSRALSVNLVDRKSVILQKGDVIKIPVKAELQSTEFIQISGPVKAAGIFPYFEGITVADVIILAGGMQNSALNGVIEIARRTYVNGIPSFEIIPIQSPSENWEEDYQQLNFPLNPLDHLFVRPAPGYQEDAVVTVKGEVKYPGDYVITNSEIRVSDILERAGGFTDYAFREGVALLRTSGGDNALDKIALKDQVKRLEELKDKLSDEESIFFNSTTENYLKIVENRITQLRKEYEGKYLTTEEGVVDLLTIDADAGVSFNDNIVLNRNRGRLDRIGVDVTSVLNDPENSPDNLVLLPGDIIEVPKKKEIVTIRGQVQYQTSTKFVNGKHFKSYISQAGGYSLIAKRARSYVVYANGDAQRVRNFLFFKRWPEIRPGSLIWVPGGKIRQVFNPERIVALTSSLITTYLVVDRLVNQ